MTEKVNVFAKELRSVIRKEVPFIPGAWVDFYDDLVIQDIVNAESAAESDIYGGKLSIVAAQIAEWNFANNDGDLEVSVATIKSLPLKLIKWLGNTQLEILSDSQQEDKKKDSPETSLVPSPQP